MTVAAEPRRHAHRSPSREAGAPRKRRSWNPAQPPKSWLYTLVLGITVVYAFFPLAWLLINTTKTQKDFISTFGFAPGSSFAFWDNLVQVFTYSNGAFARWLLNTVLYVVVGGGGAVFLAVLGGYGLAMYRFPGRKAVFLVVMGAMAVPSAVLAVPQFLMFAKIGLTNNPFSVIIPSLVAPFAFYLMYTFSQESVPKELLEAARMDGSGEFRTFFRISLPLLAPGIVTVSLFTATTTWNNYFIPLIMLKDSSWYPLTIGLNQWNQQAYIPGAEPVQNLVVMGSLITIVPLIATFLFLQRYWQAGLSAGSVKA